MSTGSVTVAYESNSLPNLPLVGETIAAARARVATLLNLPSTARPTVIKCDNTRVPASELDSYTLRANDTLEFSVPQGSKGCCKGRKGGSK